MSQFPVLDYDPLEEQLNAWSHAAGAVWQSWLRFFY
jgi:hemolysin III